MKRKNIESVFSRFSLFSLFDSLASKKASASNLLTSFDATLRSLCKGRASYHECALAVERTEERDNT